MIIKMDIWYWKQSWSCD